MFKRIFKKFLIWIKKMNSNACNAGGTTINSLGWMNIQMWFPYGYIQLPKEEKQEDNLEDKEGWHCHLCKEYYEFARINMPDKTFVCWACRNGYNT